jgi:hypothetical protein
MTVAEQPVGKAVFSVFWYKTLRKAGIPCIKRCVYNFFFRQYKAALLKNLPVSNVEHPLDEKIPFLPKKVNIYLGFVGCWVRVIGFFVKYYGKKSFEATASFIEGMGLLYAFAAEVYAKHLSTTNRPHYLGTFRFMLIHAFDPHLMCIPSLHVMVVIRMYTKFAAIARSFGDEENLAAQRAELQRGALAITEAVLYVKQHSINCVAAAMYAMTRFDAALFPPEEAADFASRLFTDAALAADDAARIREHILALYRQFLSQGEGAASWDEPLLAFLRERGGKK